MGKPCLTCGNTRTIENTSKRSKSRDGLQSKCKACKSKYQRNLAYNLSHEQFLDMYEIQDQRCAICDIEIDHSCHVDHSHKTKQVRGLLCRDCNLLLGYARDNKVFLQSAIDYLTEAGE